jgi:hypothetical protein
MRRRWPLVHAKLAVPMSSHRPNHVSAFAVRRVFSQIYGEVAGGYCEILLDREVAELRDNPGVQIVAGADVADRASTASRIIDAPSGRYLVRAALKPDPEEIRRLVAEAKSLSGNGDPVQPILVVLRTNFATTDQLEGGVLLLGRGRLASRL